MIECYNITFHTFITMISRIMLQKNTLLFAALSAALWGSATQAADAAVVASLKPLGFIASAIADGVTDTQVLLPDGGIEHDYSLRPSDVKRLQGADLVVWVGPEMEAFMEKSVRNIPDNKQVTIAQLADVKPLLMKARMMMRMNMRIRAPMRKKVTYITITANITCIFGSPQR
ncbi:high-affinity zinc transporter periplasmic protein [Salmonella enterica subsp. enterica]|uniref:High-affinity zinc uptake system protein ZnuA n=1 Tax=Salmonella enterica I TaxID=59201 RepID=A0A379VPL1_SALET|nr:high-affinity zinc transporter periplasmic protein [Salmonella enterica subsp. enterica]